MKRMSQIMKDLGFRPEGSQATKEAFIQHLLRASEGVYVQTPTQKKIVQENPMKIKELHPITEQLSFDFMKTGTESRD